MHLGTMEWVIILVIVILLFGAGRVSRVGGELGSAIREFRKGLAGDDKKALGEGSGETVASTQKDHRHAE